VNCGIGGRIGATEKLYGELTETGPCRLCRPGKSVGIGGPGLGSLKLVKTACGVPGPREFPPKFLSNTSMTLFFGGRPRFLLNMASMFVVIVMEIGSMPFCVMFHFLVYSWIL